jgi:hypothetical protein
MDALRRRRREANLAHSLLATRTRTSGIGLLDSALCSSRKSFTTNFNLSISSTSW